MNIGNAKLNYGSLKESTVRGLQTLYSTIEGTVPMDREFGLDGTMIGYPVEVIKNMYTLDVMEKTEKYFSNVKVTEVTYESIDNTLIPTIHLENGDE